ncbi:MAG: HAD family hydrolase [Micropepsaceae bacterium]
MAKKLAPMAIAYDFDGTLCPGNMQEHQFIPKIGMKPKAFWEEVREFAKVHQADPVLAYMNMMLLKAAENMVPVKRTDFQALGHGLKLFDGVEDWFGRINAYGAERGVKIEHYIISSGNEEIIAGTAIADRFTQIFASKFLFERGLAKWPALAINYTTKTQYLFRINKGVRDITDNAAVNEVVDQEDRPVPFHNIVFVGDGATDIPAFRLVKEQGGLSVAVFAPHQKGARKAASKYLTDSRVHCIAPADYTEGGEIDGIIKANIEVIAARHVLHQRLAEAGIGRG